MVLTMKSITVFGFFPACFFLLAEPHDFDLVFKNCSMINNIFHLHLADAFIQSDLQLRSTISDTL